jgi:hypothetical protein
MVVMKWTIMDVNWIIISNELDGSNEMDDNGCKLDHN